MQDNAGKQIKIMMLADSMGIGGTERRLTELLKGLRHKTNFTVELVVFSNKIAFKELYDLAIPIHILKRKTKKDISIFYKFFQLCRKIKPDIIHSWGSMATIYSLPTRWFQPVQLINAIITDAPIFTSSFDKRLVRLRLTASSSDLILANCRAGLLAYKAPAQKSKYIFNGFDFDRMPSVDRSEHTRLKYNIPDKKIIGMVGVFAPRKDYAKYLEIAQNILRQRNDVVFLAIGDGPLLDKCKSEVTLQNQKDIIFTGSVTDVEHIIQVMDIGILISNPKVHGEGISNAIMEYMAAGKPVIANKNGGNAEIIRDEITGFIIDNNDDSDWIKKINSLLDNPTSAKQMGAAGKKRIQDTFSIGRMVDSYIEAYKSLQLKKR